MVKNNIVATILYGSEVWFDFIRHKKTYLRKLNVIQRRIINSLSGAYRCSNTEKLYELLGICDLNEELIVKDLTRDVESAVRKSAKLDYRLNFLNAKNTFNFDLDIRKTSSKAIVYIITGKGPFRAFLNRIRKHDTSFCRYCGYVPETAVHLLLECMRFEEDRKSTNFRNIYSFENLCNCIVDTVQRDEHRL